MYYYRLDIYMVTVANGSAIYVNEKLIKLLLSFIWCIKKYNSNPIKSSFTANLHYL